MIFLFKSTHDVIMAEKTIEAGAVLAGGHSIDDYPPKYGMAVTGVVHPDKIITNSGAKSGESLILAKAIGTGAIVAGQRIKEVSNNNYQDALEQMKQMNLKASEIIQGFNIITATDVTGFSLLGHALEMAAGSNVSFLIKAEKVPLLNSAYELVDMGCIPGASFRNLSYIESKTSFKSQLDYNLKMLLVDPQTSGGLLFSCKSTDSKKIVDCLKKSVD